MSLSFCSVATRSAEEIEPLYLSQLHLKPIMYSEDIGTAKTSWSKCVVVSWVRSRDGALYWLGTVRAFEIVSFQSARRATGLAAPPRKELVFNSPIEMSGAKGMIVISYR